MFILVRYRICLFLSGVLYSLDLRHASSTLFLCSPTGCPGYILGYDAVRLMLLRTSGGINTN